MVYYNLSSLSNLTGFGDFVSVTNSATDGLLVGLFVLLVWLVILVYNIRFDFVRALASASFVCFLLSGFLVFLGFLSVYFLLVFLFLTALAGFILYLT